MKFLPRLVFWIGVIALVYGIIEKLVCKLKGPVAWPFGLWPHTFLVFSAVCFLLAIAYCVVFIFSEKAGE